MSDPTPPTPPTAPKRTHNDQDQKIADEITKNIETLTNIPTDTELPTLLSANGYPATKITAGLALWNTAQDSYRAHQEALAALEQANQTLTDLRDSADRTYRDFHGVARQVFPDSATRTALGVDGPVPEDRQKFITLARNGYQTALNTPTILTALTEFGWTQTRLTAALTELDALASADNAKNNATANSARTTAQRNADYDAAQTWQRQFEGIARIATRGRPDLATKLRL